MLGDGEYVVMAADRGGQKLLGEITGMNLTVRWAKDDYGECTIRIPNPKIGSCDVIEKLHSVRNEIVVFRNGRRVWEGPITRIGYYADRIEIDAKDVAWYFTRRALQYGFDFTRQSVNAVTHVYNMLRQHYPETGDPYNIGQFLTKINTPKDARTAAKRLPYEATLYEVIDNYADRGGIDYTVRGRRVTVYDTHTVVDLLPKLTNDDFFGALAIVEYGSQLVTRAYSSNNAGLVSAKQAPPEWIDFYGYVDTVVNADREGDGEQQAGEEALDDIAQRRVNEGFPSPTEVQVPANISIRPTAPVDFERLLPGAHVPIEVKTWCKTLQRYQRINQTQVTHTPEGGEDIALLFVQAPTEMVYPDA